MKPRVSVVISTYNRSEALRATLDESSRSGDSQLWVIDLNGGEAPPYRRGKPKQSAGLLQR